MRHRFMGSVAALAAGAGLAYGQQGPGMTPPQGYMDGAVPAGHQTAVIPPQIAGMSPSEAALMGGPDGGPPGGYAGEMFNGGGGATPSVPVLTRSFTGWPVIWGGVDFLLWQPKTLNVPFPIATTGAAATGGTIGNASTGVLNPGDNSFNYAPGFRITAGFFRGEDRRTGFEGSAFQIGTASKTFSITSDGAGFPLIARPFVDSTTGAQSSLIIASPNQASGSLTYKVDTGSFGAEVNYLINIYRSCPVDGCGYGVNFNALIGPRYMEIEEHLSIGSTSTNLAIPGTQPVYFEGVQTSGLSITTVTDNFKTYNQFYGGQIGTELEIRNRRSFLQLGLKLGLGAMHETADISGVSTIQRGVGPGASVSSAVGGLLANTNTIGRYHDDEFVAIPEVTLNLGYHVTSWMSASVGYNFLYINNVARPTDLANPNVNPAVVPTNAAFGTALPIVPVGYHIKQSDYSLQGVTFNLTFKY